MPIELTPKEKTTLEKTPLVTLDPDDLDCCGVDRPIADPEPCCPTYTCDCDGAISIAGCDLDETVQACNVCSTPADPDQSLDLFINRSAQVTFDNSAIVVSEFSDLTAGISGRTYLGSSDGQTLRLHFTFAVPADYIKWGDNFLTFKFKTSGPESLNAVQLRILDVDSTERYDSNRISSVGWLTLAVSKNAQSLSEGRWTPGKQMSVVIDVFVDSGNEAFVSNGAFAYS